MYNSVIQTLKQINLEENKPSPSSFWPISSTEGKLFFIYIICIIISFIWFYLWQFYRLYFFSLAAIIFLAAGYIGILIHPFISAYIHRKKLLSLFNNPLSFLYDNAYDNENLNRKRVEILSTEDIRDLELASLEITAEKNAFEKRISLLVGAIEKIGIAPGFLAFFLSIEKIKNIDLDWVLMLAYAIPILYCIGVISHLYAIKLTRHIAILDYVIKTKTV